MQISKSDRGMEEGQLGWTMEPTHEKSVQDEAGKVGRNLII